MTAVHALALLAGVLAALGWQHVDSLPAWPWAAAGLLCGLRPRLRPLATLCLGFLWASLPLQRYAAARVAADYDERVLVEAQIDGLTLRRGADETFTALLRPLHAGVLAASPTRAALRWHDAPLLHAGERWQLLVALRAPSDAVNPGSTAAAWQPLRTRLHASGEVLVSALNRRQAAAPHSLDALRERLASAIAARVDERDAAALIIALAIGDTQRVSVEQWRICNAVGITHLVAISGLHVTLFCVLVAALVGRLWRHCGWLQPRLTRHGCATAAGLVAALGYALLAGWSVPTQRTLLMLAAWHGLRVAARPRPAARTFAAGLIGVLLIDPLAPLAAGFWLSFLAVGALLALGVVAPAAAGGWRGLLLTQGWVAVALAPVTIAVFGSVSIAGLVVNLLAIPFFSLLLVPLILAATAALAIWPWLAGLLLKLAGALIGVCWPLLSQIAASPAALWQVAPPAWWYLLAAPALLVALLPWPPWMRATALLALLPAALPTNALIAPHGFAATVFDLGRGEAVLLRTATHALLYDDGESWGSHGATTAARLAPALRYYDVRTLDAVLLPRLDADRGAGVAALNAVVPLLRLAAGDARALPPEFASCGARRRWQWDGVDFEILHSGSCTLRVSSGAAALLLPGSAAAAVQARELVPRLPPTAVVLVPGGGSATARQPLLMTTAAPRLAILSGNARSPLAASTAATLAAWRDAGAQTRITGIDGALELRFEADGRIVLWSWRKP